MPWQKRSFNLFAVQLIFTFGIKFFEADLLTAQIYAGAMPFHPLKLGHRFMEDLIDLSSIPQYKER